MPNISLYHACYIELVFDLLILIFTLDTQCTCAFVGLKKGVEKTLNTEVILNLKDAVLQSFGNDVVPKDCFVSSEVRCLQQEEQSIYTGCVIDNEVFCREVQIWSWKTLHLL